MTTMNVNADTRTMTSDQNGHSNPPRETLADRSRRFSLAVIRMYASLPRGAIEACLGKQLLRSATSVGAHLSEGRRNRTRAEITSKSEVALQELEESVYWMYLMRDAGVAPLSRLDPLLQEANELTAMLVTGIKRLKQTAPRSDQSGNGQN